MDERLGFELDIDVDAHKVPAAVQLLGQMDDRLMRIGKSLERFEVGTRRMGESSNRVRGMVGNFTELASAAQLAGRAFDVVSKAWGAFEKGGDYAVKAMGERSATIRGYTQLLGGDKKQANLEYYRAQQFSQKTDFTSETIEKSQARLMAQGFRGKDLYATLFSAADLAAIMPGDKNQTLERVTMAMSQIKAKGKLQGEELTGQLAEAGLNTTMVKEQIMKSMGLKSTAEVDKKMGKGEISAAVALPAIQRAILQQLGTSKAGEYATSASGSLTGLISNRDEAVQNLLKGFDGDENLPAMDRYKKALTEQGKLFDINAKTGKQLSLVVQDMANAAVDAKSAWTEFTSGFIASFAESYDKQLRTTGRDFEGAASYASDAMERLGRAIGGLGKVTSDVVGNSNNLFGRLAGKGADVTEDEFARLGLLNQGKYGEFAYQTARGSLPGMAIGGAAGAVSRAVGKYGYGYNYQDAIIFDEFYSWIELDDMLRILDRYPYMGETKGSYTHLKASTFIFTSNDDPRDMYKKILWRRRQAFFRRIVEFGMVLHWDELTQDFRYDDIAQYYRTNNLEPQLHDAPLLARQETRSTNRFKPY